jgi:hypothetical protein
MGWTSQYVLENESGERYDLTAPASVFLVNVQGLGAQTNRTLASLNDGFFLQTNVDVPNNAITGDLVYQLGAYGNYQNLVNWIMRAKELYFCYSPLDVEYRCRVELNFINKERRNSAGCMQATISFQPLTPFYLPTPTAIDVPRAGADSKGYEQQTVTVYLDGVATSQTIYCYTYDDALYYAPELGGDMAAQIIPSGHVPAAFLLRYTGAITNPVITLTGQQSGKIYGKCEVTGTFTGTDVLELCTAQRDSYVRKISGGVTTDLMAAGAVNLAFEPYPRAPVDEPSALTVEDGNGDPLTGTAELTVFAYYRSV